MNRARYRGAFAPKNMTKYDHIRPYGTISRHLYPSLTIPDYKGMK